MSKEYLPDTEKRILLSALSHEMKLVKDNNLTELIPVVKNLDYKFMYDRLFKKIEDNAYEQGRADERNEIIKELGNQLTQANCEQGIEFVMSRIRYVLGEEQKNDC